jgi:hypothetical protein
MNLQNSGALRGENADAHPDILARFNRAAATSRSSRCNGYAPVNRHRSFEFGEAKTSEDKVILNVHIIDADGVAWEAQHTLQRQTDGTMKIIGCL